MPAIILNTRIDESSYEYTCRYIQSLAQSQQPGYIVAANVHVVVTAYWNAHYRRVVNDAALVVPDGMPLVFGLRWLGFRKQPRVYGPELMHSWCERAADLKLPVYLYGGSNKTLQQLSEKLARSFPSLKIAGTHSPPFRELSAEEEEADIARIEQSGAAVVFVGLGCPKQEEWMYRNKDKLNPVMIGVGAAFRFHSGEVRQAPRWLMKLSLEWLFRLIQEPQRLWSRYLFTNSAFIFLFGRQLLQHNLNHVIRRCSRCATDD